MASCKQIISETTIFLIFSLLLVQFVHCDSTIETNVIVSKSNTNKHDDSCTVECVKKVSVGSNNVVSGDSCSRGCRFFTLAQLIGRKQYEGKSFIAEACKAMCEESYGNTGNDATSCRTGCESSTVNNFQVPVVAEFSWSWFIDSGNSMQILQGDVPEPDDVLTDPSLRSQITRVKTLRIPEIRLRTMPVLQDKNGQMEGAPTLCTGVRVRGIQSCLVGSLLLLLTMVGLWSCLGEVRDHRYHPVTSPPPLYHPFK